MAGWSSRYDRPDQSNLEKLSGRKLHVQDNYWFMSKVCIVVLIGFVIYLITTGDLNLDGIIKIYEWTF